MSDDIVTWEDPPETSKPAGEYGRGQKIVDQLKANHGEWAKVLTGISSSYATQIRKGYASAWRPVSDFEITTRVVDSGTKRVDVYARYIGQEAGQ